MWRNFFKQQLALFLMAFFVASCFLSVESSYAIYTDVRSGVNWNPSRSMCETGSFDFDPLTDNKDVEWQLDNPTCIGFMAGAGLSMMLAGQIVKRLMCKATPGNVQGTSRMAADEAGDPLPDIPSVTPNVAYKLVYRSGYLCPAFVADTLFYSAGLPGTSAAYTAAQGDAIKCCAGVAAYGTAVGAAIAVLNGIYTTAKGSYDSGRICGHDWNVWGKVDDNGEEVFVYQPEYFSARWRYGKYSGSHQRCVEEIFINNSNSCGYVADSGCAIKAGSGYVSCDPFSVTIQNKYYREYLYDGVEFEDTSSDACFNPASWNGAKKKSSLGYDSIRQRYYMKGPGVAANYACQRFILAAATDPTVQAAYDCCKARSQGTMCIENRYVAGLGEASEGNSYQHEFCKGASKCTVNSVQFQTYYSHVNPNLLCAKTYSVCPYNHLLGGGTEVARHKINPDQSPSTDLENFCQLNKHCAKVPVPPYVRISSLEGAYISTACKNLVGDSQNVYAYSADLAPINNRGFSSPLVQCFKESLQNMLLNKAGDTKCQNPDEFPNNNICASGHYSYQKDNPLTTPSFFGRLQDNLQTIIKIALTISITLFGAMVLLGGEPVGKKKILTYVLKIALVMFFAAGDGWQHGFVDGILSSSNDLSDIMMRLDYSTDPAHLDGCQFPKYNYADTDLETKYNNPSYPPGREYIKIWDTLDCKLARALGFGPDLSVPNLVKMILAGFLTGGLGIIFLIGTFMFAFFMLSVVMRAMHIFLMATVAIIILIYVSPITITLAMFERTKGIFDGWWKQILGMALQPVILFAYLGIYVGLFDQLMMGSATFRGDGRSVPKTISCNAPDANNTSIYCIFGVADIKTYTGLEIIGIGLPLLANMNQDKLNTIIKAAFIMFIFAQFIDKISTLASELVGGSQLDSKSPSAMAMASKAFGVARGVQKRGMGLARKGAGVAARGGAAVKGFVSGVANRGKSVASAPKEASGAARVEAGGGGATKTEDSAAGSSKTESSDSSSSKPAEPPKA